MNKDIRPDKTSPAYLKKTKSGGLQILFFLSMLVMFYLVLYLYSFKCKKLSLYAIFLNSSVVNLSSYNIFYNNYKGLYEFRFFR